jgi:hypothetical protein
VGAERIERRVDSPAHLAGVVRAEGQLAGDPDVVAVQAARPYGRADAGLVAVVAGGVDVPVAGPQRLADKLLGVAWGDLVGAEREPGPPAAGVSAPAA